MASECVGFVSKGLWSFFKNGEKEHESMCTRADTVTFANLLEQGINLKCMQSH